MRIARRYIRSFDPSGTEHNTVNRHIDDVVKVLNGEIEFGTGTASGNENVSCDFALVVFDGVPGTELTANHNLKRVPVGAWMIKQNKAGTTYWTDTATSAVSGGDGCVFLASDAASLSGVLIIF